MDIAYGYHLIVVEYGVLGKEVGGLEIFKKVNGKNLEVRCDFYLYKGGEC